MLQSLIAAAKMSYFDLHGRAGLRCDKSIACICIKPKALAKVRMDKSAHAQGHVMMAGKAEAFNQKYRCKGRLLIPSAVQPQKTPDNYLAVSQHAEQADDRLAIDV